MSGYHQCRLPDHSDLLAGRKPPSAVGFQSDALQIWYNNTDSSWHDPAPHKHTNSDECFVVLRGELVVEVEGERFTVGPREFCCFPRGLYHAVIDAYPPIETLMIRAPSVEDKHYREYLVDGRR